MADDDRIEERPPPSPLDRPGGPKPERQGWWRLNWDRAAPWIAITISVTIAAVSVVGAILQTNHINQARAQEYDEKLRAWHKTITEDFRILKDDTREDIREIRAHIFQDRGDQGQKECTD